MKHAYTYLLLSGALDSDLKWCHTAIDSDTFEDEEEERKQVYELFTRHQWDEMTCDQVVQKLGIELRGCKVLQNNYGPFKFRILW